MTQTTHRHSTVGTSNNPVSPWHGEQAIRAAVELWKFETEYCEKCGSSHSSGNGIQYPEKPADVQTTLLALRLYCEREQLNFRTLFDDVMQDRRR